MFTLLENDVLASYTTVGWLVVGDNVLVALPNAFVFSNVHGEKTKQQKSTTYLAKTSALTVLIFPWAIGSTKRELLGYAKSRE
jgi:hypothetical protein